MKVTCSEGREEAVKNNIIEPMIPTFLTGAKDKTRVGRTHVCEGFINKILFNQKIFSRPVKGFKHTGRRGVEQLG